MATDNVNNFGVQLVDDVEKEIDKEVSVNGSKNLVENNNPDSFQEISVENRVKRKAKRPSKLVVSEENSVGNVVNVNGSYLRYTKNSRRSRNGLGRGLPKKGGAGGKGTWGKPGSELMLEVEDIVSDIHDPNYDDENQDDCEFEAIAPELSFDDLEKTVEPIICEYFEHGDTKEVIACLGELNFGKLRSQIVWFAINLAMERKPSLREMTSVLLSDMYGHILRLEDIAAGFDNLLQSLPDLILDTPDAATVLGNFIARAVADDCLPPKFVQSYKGKVECVHARAALEHADALLSMKHGLVRLDNVWGVGGGMRPVKYLINQMHLLLKEYLCSGDSDEACRCIRELEVPHFHHELVYEALIMVIEDMRDSSMDLMCKLFQVLASSMIVTPDQMTRGFLRVYGEMPDIVIDVPPAYTVLEKFVNSCHAAGFLLDDVVKKMPSRGRKRFVSEGDGGLVKTH
ncbi:programmed cell death protein 4 [Parasteatoda tepidariorum]|uniref:programmed cell death protein 4 n=1 Tax=Parasteatoda tepidariorum TaxID=114398 RepID=UPI000A2BFC41|nr:programmed cell death protein 4 [Parasteatoda tepidariorum]